MAVQLKLLKGYLNLTGEEYTPRQHSVKQMQSKTNIKVIAYQTYKKIQRGVIDVVTTFHLSE